MSFLLIYIYLQFWIHTTTQRIKTAEMSFPRTHRQHEMSCLVGVAGQRGTSAQWKFSFWRLLKNFFWDVVVETIPLFWNCWIIFFFLWIRIKKYFALLRYRKAKLGLVLFGVFLANPFVSSFWGNHTKIPYIPDSSKTMSPVDSYVILTLLSHKHTKPAQNRFLPLSTCMFG